MSNLPSPPSGVVSRLRRPVEVIVVSSVMFTFISFWRTAAVVLCDLASTAYYIGGIVEGAIGPAAPWFILAVMLFSYAVRSIYIESCSLFVRGGVYRVVKEALGGFPASSSVSALMFDYVLTGPVSGMSAGQYIMGLVLDSLAIFDPHLAFADPTLPMPSAAGAPWRSRALSPCISFARTSWAFTSRAASPEDHGCHDRDGSRHPRLVRCARWPSAARPTIGSPRLPNLWPKVEHEVVKGKDPVTGEIQEMWKQDPATGQFVPKMEPNGRGGLREKPKINEATGQQEDPLGFIRGTGPIAGRQAPAAGTLVEHRRHHRVADRLRSLDPGHERRRNAGPGLPRGRVAEAAELQEGGLRRLRLQPRC